jgi:hypothetical protein
LAGVHPFLYMYTRLGEPLQMLFPIRGIHNMCGLFASVEAIFVKRAEHSVFLVDSVEESAHMISAGEIDTCELYRMFTRPHISPRSYR